MLAPDLAGMGRDRTPLVEVSLSRWADDIAALIDAESEPVILLGHSRAGIVISEVAQRRPAKIAMLVYLAAFLIPSGRDLFTTIQHVKPGFPKDALIPASDGTTTLRQDLIGPIVYQLTEPYWVQRACRNVGAEPMQVFGTPVHLTAERYGRVRRTFIETADDRAIPLAFQREMQVGLPCERVYTLESDHSPFYSRPTECAACLLSIAEVSTAHAEVPGIQDIA